MASPATLSALLKQTTLDDPEEYLKAANNALKQSKTDQTAQHVRVVALLQLDRYDDALRAFTDGGEPLKERAKLEWAYTLYRTGNFEQAESVLRGSSETRGLSLLEAQTAYRREDFERAADIYKRVSDQGALDGSEESELKINRAAVDAQLAWNGSARATKPKISSADLEQFDTAFNAACGCIARGEIKQADFLLGRAKALCNAADELSDAQKKDELVQIEAQHAYVYSMLGKLDEARAVCADLRQLEIPDKATNHVAQANDLLISGRGSANPYLAQRLFGSTSKLAPNEAPFKFQQSILAQNQLTLDLAANKFGAVSKAGQVNLTGNGAVENAWIGVFNAAAHARSRTGKEAIKEILPVLERRTHDVGLVLTLVQLYVFTNNVQTATSLLETFLGRLESSSSASDRDLCYAPGLVATLASLYANQRRISSAKTALAKAARHWRHRSKDIATSKALLQAAGAALLESPTEEEAGFAHELFAMTIAEHKSDPISTAGLVASQPEGATDETLSSALPTIEELTQGVDVEALEAAGVARPPAKAAPASSSAKRAAEATPKAPKAKRMRKSRMPKDFDPNKKPDPERWLPLRDRSNWRPKGKKKNKSQGGGGTQGGITNDEGKGQGLPPQQQQQQQQLMQKPGSGSKSKKKKGKGK